MIPARSTGCRSRPPSGRVPILLAATARWARRAAGLRVGRALLELVTLAAWREIDARRSLVGRPEVGEEFGVPSVMGIISRKCMQVKAPFDVGREQATEGAGVSASRATSSTARALSARTENVFPSLSHGAHGGEAEA